MKEFKHDKTTLLNCDCMEYMAGLEDNAFDLAVCDVPYGIGECGKSNHSRVKRAAPTLYTEKHWDISPPKHSYFNELKRVSKNQILFGANHFVENISNSSCWIVWDKLNGASDFADCELAYTSFKTAVRIFKYRWSGMLQGDMKNKQKRIHPTEKPIALYKWIFANYAKPGQRILDTHGGSFSSAIAAHYFGCDFVGMELDPDYYTAAVERFKKETRQIDMIGYMEGTL